VWADDAMHTQFHHTLGATSPVESGGKYKLEGL
jgi:hypothetical protein